MKRTYSISQLANEFEITTRTIRFYEDEGLLAPQRKGQTRIYSEGDRVRLMLILRGKRLGFTLADAGEIINLYDPTTGNIKQFETFLAKLSSRRKMLSQQLHDIEIMQKELDTAEQKIRLALSQELKKSKNT